MPIELFISYRRSDAAGHARALFAALKDEFAPDSVFFDRQAIESGDRFAQLIGTSVSECKLLLALIGPDWLQAAQVGQRRLDDPADFVRLEIDQALREGKRVIPVLFDDTPMPRPADLPEPLRALAGIDAFVLRGKDLDYEHQLRELVRLATAAGITPAPPRRAPGSVTADRSKLVNLCDRSPQDSDTRDLLHAQLKLATRRPFVLVVHGRAEELPQEFVVRLEEFSMPSVLKNKGLAPGFRFVRYTDVVPVDSAERFNRSLRMKLAEELESDLFDDDRALLELLQKHKLGALVAVLSWRASELSGDALLPLRRLFDYWAAFPDVGGRALIGCIAYIKYDRSEADAGWLKRMFSKGSDRTQTLRDAVAASQASFGASPRVAWRVLEELPSVRASDLDRWKEAVEDIIKRRLGVTDDDLHRIIEGESQPMQVVLPRLEALIPPQ